MPRTVAESSCVTEWFMRRSPRALTVASCLGLSPIMLLVRVILSVAATGGLLRPVAIGGAPADRLQLLKPLDAPQGIDGRLEHIVGIVGPEGFRGVFVDGRRTECRGHG